MTNSKVVKGLYSTCIIITTIMIIGGVYLCGAIRLAELPLDYVRNIAVDTMGMLVGGVLILGLFSEMKKDKQSVAMLMMIFILNILFYIDILTSYMEGRESLVIAIKSVNTISFVAEELIAYSYWVYIREELKISGRATQLINRICICLLGIATTMDILNWKFGFFFTVSKTGRYVDSPFEFVGDLAIVIVLIVSLVAIVKNRTYNIHEKLVLLSFETFPLLAYIIGILTQDYIFMTPAYLLSVMLIYIRIFLERGKRMAEQQVVLTKQSTALMISQIQPHFLYNVLTTISNLCATDPEEAEETTVLFSQYLRTNLDSLRIEEPVPFMMELGHIKTYVELEKKRFIDILNVEYDIKETNFKVPSLGLQPIVENSIKHGIRGKNAKGNIKISTDKVENGYIIIIEDDGIGFDMNAPKQDDGRSHVGMNNVKERLRQMCNAVVEVESSPGNGCRTRIFIPQKI